MNSLIELSDIHKTYNGKDYVLENLDFSLSVGEIAIINGESGSGKSTFLNIVGLLDKYNKGSYRFKEQQISSKKVNRYDIIRAQSIGFIFQSYYLIDLLTVWDNLLMPYLYNGRKISKEVVSRGERLLDEYNLYDLKDKKAVYLSGGEKQRVAIARAMLKNPELIIADEPTGNLDDNNSELVVKSFASAAEQGSSIIIVTHDLNISVEGATRYHLAKGCLHAC